MATYNVHGCVGIDGKRSEERIADVIASLHVDVIGLQELDLNRRRSAGRDQAGWIAERLGWERHFHPAMQTANEAYGDAILSRYPMNLRQAAVLPCRPSALCPETRGALRVEIKTPLGRVHVINTHFGLGRRERFAQARLLGGSEWIGRVPADEPLILLGDFNSAPGSAAYRELTLKLADVRSFARWQPLRTFPTPFPVLAVDHIFINPLLYAAGVQIERGDQARLASDHYPLVASLHRTEGGISTTQQI